jgi:histidine kinase
VLTITISDQGIGIREAEIERVFERFYRAGGNPSVHGTGLGLYLSRHLVEVQGGQITASSPGLGNGAEFTVTLPIDPDWRPITGEETPALASTE